MSNLMTSFFQLGGVLIATSNRMPEELAKAAGVEFAPPPTRMESLTWRLGLRERRSEIGRSENMFAGKGEFANFLEVLKARCEVWEMEGRKDYRRREAEDGLDLQNADRYSDEPEIGRSPGIFTKDKSPSEDAHSPTTTKTLGTAPPQYFIKPFSNIDSAGEFVANFNTTILRIASLPPNATAVPWTSRSIRVYGRNVPIPRHYSGITHWTFAELCQTELGPADYITLASTFHTFILTDIPVLTILHKNEARRFITLLDALYEARCKLLVSAAAGPDDLFFPETRRPRPNSSSPANGKPGEENVTEDALLAETFAEAYQDVTAPFRPNISSYSSSTSSLAPDALEDDPPNRLRRPGSSSSDVSSGDAHHARRSGPDFGAAGAFTGEDERFAYRRARSRLWELCGRRWWAREENGWWRPLDRGLRGWEGRADDGGNWALPGSNGRDTVGRDADVEAQVDAALARAATSDTYTTMMRDPVLDGKRATDGASGARGESGMEKGGQEGMGAEREVDERLDEPLFRHGASPFRTSKEPPPKFSWTHIWGTMRWGSKAGAWGKGVEGLEERRKEKERERSGDGEDSKEDRKGNN
ncbi:MAG: hypothetical protein M1822_001374 [Bathelium mastoideum]|nr:MAG: hypothetical protein M1822_001374 [Bathelium mastoideum]